jgi:hypothetical protein
MFNLEQSIAEWRNQMLATGIKSPVPLEELESHLRDEIETQIKSGEHVKQAFEGAVWTIGNARVLKDEFKKSAAAKDKSESLFELICAAVTFLFSLYGGLFVIYWSVRDLQSSPTESYLAGALACLLFGLVMIAGAGRGALMCLTKIRMRRNHPANKEQHV